MTVSPDFDRVDLNLYEVLYGLDGLYGSGVRPCVPPPVDIRVSISLIMVRLVVDYMYYDICHYKYLLPRTWSPMDVSHERRDLR